MGLTLIRKSEGTRRKRNPKVALVLAGGAISGGAFKVGGLKALDDFLVERKITDLDLYVGLSAGSILAVVARRRHHARRDDQGARGHERAASSSSRPFDFYNPNLREFVDAAREASLYDLCSLPARASRSTSLRSVPGLPEALGAAAARVRAQAELHAPRSRSRWR